MADHLAELLAIHGAGAPWVRRGFADKVKQIFCDTHHVDLDFIERWKRVPEPPPGFDLPVRDCLILIGDGFRRMKKRVWIEEVFYNQPSHQIISDMRYVNEAVYVREMGGVAVLLWRPGHENDVANASEQELMPYVRQLAALRRDGVVNDPAVPFDLFLVNDGTLADLRRKVEGVVLPYVLDALDRLD